MNMDEIIRLMQAVAALPSGTQLGVGIVTFVVVVGGIYAVVELGRRLIDGIVNAVGKVADSTVRITQELGRAFGRYPPEPEKKPRRSVRAGDSGASEKK